jgi:hypothetical protein
MHVAYGSSEVKLRRISSGMKRRAVSARKEKRRPANGTAFLMNLWDFSESRLKA